MKESPIFSCVYHYRWVESDANGFSSFFTVYFLFVNILLTIGIIKITE